MPELLPFLVALALAVALAAVLRGLCDPSTNPLADEHEAGDEPPAFILKISVSDFLEFLSRVRQAIRQSQRA